MSTVEIASSVATVPNTTRGPGEVQQAAQRRTGDRADLEHSRVDRHRLGEKLRPHQVRHQRLRGRHRERARHAEQHHHREHRTGGVHPSANASRQTRSVMLRK